MKQSHSLRNSPNYNKMKIERDLPGTASLPEAVHEEEENEGINDNNNNGTSPTTRSLDTNNNDNNNDNNDATSTSRNKRSLNTNSKNENNHHQNSEIQNEVGSGVVTRENDLFPNELIKDNHSNGSANGSAENDHNAAALTAAAVLGAGAGAGAGYLASCSRDSDSNSDRPLMVPEDSQEGTVKSIHGDSDDTFHTYSASGQLQRCGPINPDEEIDDNYKSSEELPISYQDYEVKEKEIKKLAAKNSKNRLLEEAALFRTASVEGNKAREEENANLAARDSSVANAEIDENNDHEDDPYYIASDDIRTLRENGDSNYDIGDTNSDSDSGSDNNFAMAGAAGIISGALLGGMVMRNNSDTVDDNDEDQDRGVDQFKHDNHSNDSFNPFQDPSDPIEDPFHQTEEDIKDRMINNKIRENKIQGTMRQQADSQLLEDPFHTNEYNTNISNDSISKSHDNNNENVTRGLPCQSSIISNSDSNHEKELNYPATKTGGVIPQKRPGALVTQFINNPFDEDSDVQVQPTPDFEEHPFFFSGTQEDKDTVDDSTFQKMVEPDMASVQKSSTLTKKTSYNPFDEESDVQVLPTPELEEHPFGAELTRRRSEEVNSLIDSLLGQDNLGIPEKIVEESGEEKRSRGRLMEFSESEDDDQGQDTIYDDDDANGYENSTDNNDHKLVGGLIIGSAGAGVAAAAASMTNRSKDGNEDEITNSEKKEATYDNDNSKRDEKSMERDPNDDNTNNSRIRTTIAGAPGAGLVRHIKDDDRMYYNDDYSTESEEEGIYDNFNKDNGDEEEQIKEECEKANDHNLEEGRDMETKEVDDFINVDNERKDNRKSNDNNNSFTEEEVKNEMDNTLSNDDCESEEEGDECIYDNFNGESEDEKVGKDGSEKNTGVIQTKVEAERGTKEQESDIHEELTDEEIYDYFQNDDDSDDDDNYEPKAQREKSAVSYVNNAPLLKTIGEEEEEEEMHNYFQKEKNNNADRVGDDEAVTNEDDDDIYSKTIDNDHNPTSHRVVKDHEDYPIYESFSGQNLSNQSQETLNSKLRDDGLENFPHDENEKERDKNSTFSTQSMYDDEDKDDDEDDDDDQSDSCKDIDRAISRIAQPFMVRRYDIYNTKDEDKQMQVLASPRSSFSTIDEKKTTSPSTQSPRTSFPFPIMATVERSVSISSPPSTLPATPATPTVPKVPKVPSKSTPPKTPTTPTSTQLFTSDSDSETLPSASMPSSFVDNEKASLVVSPTPAPEVILQSPSVVLSEPNGDPNIINKKKGNTVHFENIDLGNVSIGTPDDDEKSGGRNSSAMGGSYQSSGDHLSYSSINSVVSEGPHNYCEPIEDDELARFHWLNESDKSLNHHEKEKDEIKNNNGGGIARMESYESGTSVQREDSVKNNYFYF
eukprot:Awhi_evm2s5306